MSGKKYPADVDPWVGVLDHCDPPSLRAYIYGWDEAGEPYGADEAPA